MTENNADMGKAMQIWQEIQRKRLSVAQNQKQINKLKKENKVDIPLIAKMLDEFNDEMMSIAKMQADSVNSSLPEDDDDEDVEEDDEDEKTDTDDSDDDDDEDDKSDSKDQVMNMPKNDTKMKEIEVKNLVYQATFALFEHLEHNKRYQGNGHHLAQRVCELVWLKYSDDDRAF